MFKSLIDGTNINSTLDEILAEFHFEGPVSQLSLEKLAYIKKYHPDAFEKYEQKILSLMGLFYKPSSKSTSLLEEVYSVFASSISDETGQWFTPVQASALKSIKTNKYFSFSAPTSSGKSFLFRQLIAEATGDIIIVVPSRALISEYYFEVLEIVKNKKEVLVLQFIDNINTAKTERRVFIITPERGIELFKRSADFNIELFLLDEAQISEDKKRGLRFDSFVRRIKKEFPNAKKVFAHPFVENPEAQLEKHSVVTDCKSSTFKQGSVGKIFLSYKNRKFRHFSPNTESEKIDCTSDPIAEVIKRYGTLLVYASKKKIYDGQFLIDFQKYISLCSKITDTKALKLIETLKEFIGAGNEATDKRSQLIEMMKIGVVVHHGSIPLKGRLLIEEFIRLGAARICFATSTLNQGINMPFDVVWIDNFTSMDILGLKNLIGRSGRTKKNWDTFDYGYTIVNEKNVETFSERFKDIFRISNTSGLDSTFNEVPEDFKDFVDAFKHNSFNDSFHLPEIQVNRISNDVLDQQILFILDSLFNESKLISGNDYLDLAKPVRENIKLYFKNIYVQHLRRKKLTKAEASVLSIAIPILLWHIQGRSFSQVVSLRHAYLSRKTEQKLVLGRLKAGHISAEQAESEIDALKVKFSQAPSSIPDINMRFHSSFSGKVTALDFDHVVYDTYDYLDKVIGLSLVDPICAVFELFFNRTQDARALALANYIRYGTDDEKEIYLMRYGFGFEEIEWIKPHILTIDSTKIEFEESVRELGEEKKSVIERYLD